MNPASPFSRRAALGIVALGAALFVLALWLVGAGLSGGTANDGGSHGAGKGLTGYAALAALLERQGWEVSEGRTEAALQQPGLLVLTPPAGADAAALARVVDARREIGPTLVVTPKWQAVPLDKLDTAVPGAKAGWTTITGTAPPEWQGFLDQLGVALGPLPGGRWRAAGGTGALPEPRAVLSGRGEGLVPLVAGNSRGGPILAGYMADDGDYPALDAMALMAREPGDPGSAAYPLIVVFEPDLIDNWGLARRENALLALRLVNAASDGAPRRVTFDLTFNGLARKPNLLTLAFTPPFLAATLCLLLAALIAGWRAFLRFGPARAPVPALAFGKAALVANAGGLVRRSGRLHLLAAPYAAMVRERVARALGLPRHADPAQTEAAIDRALAARTSDGRAPAAPPFSTPPFSTTAAALRGARRPIDLLRAAQDLHAAERTLLE